VQEDLAGVVHHADVHGAGVQVDAAVVLVLPGVKSGSSPESDQSIEVGWDSV
jgi:hypothetical protein